MNMWLNKCNCLPVGHPRPCGFILDDPHVFQVVDLNHPLFIVKFCGVFKEKNFKHQADNAVCIDEAGKNS